MQQLNRLTSMRRVMLFVAVTLIGCAGTPLSNFVQKLPPDAPIDVPTSPYNGVITGFDPKHPMSWQKPMPPADIFQHNYLVRGIMWTRDYRVVSLTNTGIIGNRIYNNGSPMSFAGPANTSGDEYTFESDQRAIFVSGDFIVQVVRAEGEDVPLINVIDPKRQRVWIHVKPDKISEDIFPTEIMQRLDFPAAVISSRGSRQHSSD